MIVTSKLNMDLAYPRTVPKLFVMQDDRYSRNIEVSLYVNGIPMNLIEGFRVLIRYGKPDGKNGAYDTLPDGTQAWKIQDNRVTLSLAPQVCTTAGEVKLLATLILNKMELTTFEIILHVTARPNGIPASSNYVNITGFLPQPAAAASGQFLKVTWVDEFGRVAGMETAELTGLPAVTVAEDGAFLRVVNGAWTAAQLGNAEEVSF